jgi:hypothetical protein
MRPNQGIGVLVRCNRSDSRDTAPAVVHRMT